MPSNRFDLNDRVALVTGAASGLGRAFAVALSEAGARVACVDRDAALLDETMALLEGPAVPIRADLASAEAVERALGEALAWSGGALDILINNAGIATPPGRLLDVSVEDWDRGVAINLRSVFLVTRASMPALLRSGHASIVNMSSFLGLKGLYPGFAITAVPYASTKAAIVGFTRQIAAEYARDGVRVNAVAPGWHGGTRLGRERRATSSEAEVEAFEAHIRSSVPMGHRGTPDDLVGLILYLASDASRYVTGQVFAHDGGLTAV